MMQQYVLACLDGAVLSEAVCDYGIWLSKTLSLPLRFLNMIEHGFQGEQDLSGAIGLGASEDLLQELSAVEENRSKLLRRQGQLMLEAAKTRAQEAGIIDVAIEQRHGGLVDRLVEIEAELAFAVIGIRGVSHENEQHALGAQLEALVRSVQKPVLVVNCEFEAPKTCMLAFDGSDASQRALALLKGYPQFGQYPWVLAHAAEEGATESPLHAPQQSLDQAGYGQLILEVRRDKPEDALVFCQASNNVNLTVMGAYSHHPLRGFIFGSFTEKMLRMTKRPLLLVH